MTATSVVPPPMSTIMLPLGSVIGRPAPMAAIIACSTRKTSEAPAPAPGSPVHTFAAAPGGAGLETFDENPAAMGGLVAGGVDRLDVQERPPLLGELNGLGEGAVGLHRHRLLVDRHRRAGLGVPA